MIYHSLSAYSPAGKGAFEAMVVFYIVQRFSRLS